MTPREEEEGGLPAAPECPFCAGRETELAGAFGAHASTAGYWCRRCRSPFEILKWRTASSATDSPSPEGRT